MNDRVTFHAGRYVLVHTIWRTYEQGDFSRDSLSIFGAYRKIWYEGSRFRYPKDYAWLSFIILSSEIIPP